MAKYIKNQIPTEILTYDEVVQIGLNQGGPALNNIPKKVTIQNTDLFLIEDGSTFETSDQKQLFTSQDVLVIGVDNEVYPVNSNTAKKLYRPVPTDLEGVIVCGFNDLLLILNDIKDRMEADHGDNALEALKTTFSKIITAQNKLIQYLGGVEMEDNYVVAISSLVDNEIKQFNVVASSEIEAFKKAMVEYTPVEWQQSEIDRQSSPEYPTTMDDIDRLYPDHLFSVIKAIV